MRVFVCLFFLSVDGPHAPTFTFDAFCAISFGGHFATAAYVSLSVLLLFPTLELVDIVMLVDASITKLFGTVADISHFGIVPDVSSISHIGTDGCTFVGSSVCVLASHVFSLSQFHLPKFYLKFVYFFSKIILLF